MDGGAVPGAVQMGEGMKEVWLSFTSISARLPHIDAVMDAHIRLARRHNLAGVCLALQEDAVAHMTDSQRKLVAAGLIELLTVPRDHGSNTKWTLTRARHPKAALIVVDDDRTYPDSMAADFLEWSARHPGCVLCRALRTLPETAPGAPVKYTLAKGDPCRARLVTSLDARSGPLLCDTRRVVLEHWAGMFYPAEFPDPAFADEAAAVAPHDDDVFLTAMATRAGRAAVLVPSCDRMLYVRDIAKETCAVAESALGRDNRLNGWVRTQGALNRMRGEFF